MTELAVDVRGLRKRYGEVTAVGIAISSLPPSGKSASSAPGAPEGWSCVC
ncbi:hypothetical protein ACFYZ9_22895 [Streptomyces sp. NPDC001691]|nr:hypothetical protein [Streptomyces sp. SDr-06]